MNVFLDPSRSLGKTLRCNPGSHHFTHRLLGLVWLILAITLIGCRPDPMSTPQPQSDTNTTPTRTIQPSRTPIILPNPVQASPTLWASQTAIPTESRQLCSPLAEHGLAELAAIVSSAYDPPPMGKDDRHQGVDFAYYNQGGRASIQGETVQAILPGRVVVAMADRLPYGNMVLVETRQEDLAPGIPDRLGMQAGESLYHLYAHFQDTPLVQAGEWVTCGQALGQVGMTGYNIPVAHLHLETRLGPAGAQIRSMGFYDTQASQDEMEAYHLWRMSGVFRHFDPLVLLVSGEQSKSPEP